MSDCHPLWRSIIVAFFKFASYLDFDISEMNTWGITWNKQPDYPFISSWQLLDDSCIKQVVSINKYYWLTKNYIHFSGILLWLVRFYAIMKKDECIRPQWNSNQHFTVNMWIIFLYNSSLEKHLLLRNQPTANCLFYITR